MSHLIHGVLDAMSRALRSIRTVERVHFHAGDHGRPYLCEDPRCSSPALHIARSCSGG